MSATSEQAGKKPYRLANWREYNESLVRRGDVTFWFSEDVVERWEHENGEVRRGRPFVYSDLAIESLLTLPLAAREHFIHLDGRVVISSPSNTK